MKKVGNLGFFGVNFIFVDYGDMTRNANEPILDPTTGEHTGNVRQVTGLGTFSAHDLAFGISYSRQITDRLQFGVNLKYLEEKLDDATANQFAIDIGTVYYTGIKSFRIAMLGRNFGPGAEFLDFDERIGYPTAKVKLPMTYILGGAIDILEGGENSPHLWTIAGEFIHTNDASEKANVGTEYSFMEFVMLRAGYRFNYDEEGITLGAGLNLHMADIGMNINYAYMVFGRLDSVNMFSFNFGF